MPYGTFYHSTVDGDPRSHEAVPVVGILLRYAVKVIQRLQFASDCG